MPQKTFRAVTRTACRAVAARNYNRRASAAVMRSGAISVRDILHRPLTVRVERG